MLAARGASRLAYHFEGTEPPGCVDPPHAPADHARSYRNPIAVAREWLRLLLCGNYSGRRVEQV